MNKIVLLFIVSLVGLQISAQQIVKESIDSGGGIASATGVKIIHTIGEVVIAEKSTSNLQVSEGFISPDFQAYLTIDNFTELMGISAFPNPTTTTLNIHFSEASTVQIQVFDMSGKVVKQVQTNNQIHYNLNVSDLQSATYIILLKNNNTKQFKTFRVMKE